jgi:hypothetical protein
MQQKNKTIVDIMQSIELQTDNHYYKEFWSYLNKSCNENDLQLLKRSLEGNKFDNIYKYLITNLITNLIKNNYDAFKNLPNKDTVSKIQRILIEVTITKLNQTIDLINGEPLDTYYIPISNLLKYMHISFMDQSSNHVKDINACIKRNLEKIRHDKTANWFNLLRKFYSMELFPGEKDAVKGIIRTLNEIQQTITIFTTRNLIQKAKAAQDQQQPIKINFQELINNANPENPEEAWRDFHFKIQQQCSTQPSSFTTSVTTKNSVLLAKRQQPEDTNKTSLSAEQSQGTQSTFIQVLEQQASQAKKRDIKLQSK